MRIANKALIGVLLAVALASSSLTAWGQINPYVYVQMSMVVPWLLYFVFLACILIPFFLMIYVAWRRFTSNSKDKTER